jgi:hypothetical protein
VAISLVELVLLLTAGMMFFRRHQLSTDLLSHVCVAHVSIINFALIFLPSGSSASNASLLWLVGYPFFISYVLSVKAATRWLMIFFVAGAMLAFVLYMKEVTLPWPWQQAPFITIIYLVSAVLALLFSKHLKIQTVMMKQAIIQKNEVLELLKEKGVLSVLDIERVKFS